MMNAKRIAKRIVAEDGWCWTCNEAEDDCRCFDEPNWLPGAEAFGTKYPRPADVEAGLIASGANDTLEKTLEWIGNLNDAFGRDAVLDRMPNNFGGTIAIRSLIDAGSSDESALLRAARYTLENLDAGARENLITAPRSFQSQLGESAKMLREAIAGVDR